MTDRRTVRLREILVPAQEPVVILDDQEYRQVTVRTKALGVAERAVRPGDKIGTKRQFRVREGQWLVSRIDARNGAMGFVPAKLDGAVVTQDFPVFAIDEARCSPGYFRAVTSTGEFWDSCLMVSEGSTNRVRLKIERFLDLTIDLPSLAEQAAAVEAATRLQGVVDATRAQALAARGLLEALWSQTWNHELATVVPRRLADVTEVSSGGTPSRQRPEFFHGDIPWVKTGEVAFNELADTEERISGAAIAESSAKLFPAGTVVVAMYGQGATRGRCARQRVPLRRVAEVFGWTLRHASEVADQLEVRLLGTGCRLSRNASGYRLVPSSAALTRHQVEKASRAGNGHRGITKGMARMLRDLIVNGDFPGSMQYASNDQRVQLARLINCGFVHQASRSKRIDGDVAFSLGLVGATSSAAEAALPPQGPEPKRVGPPGPHYVTRLPGYPDA